MQQQILIVFPLRHQTVRLQAAVSYDWLAIEAFADDLSFGKSLIRIALDGCRRRLGHIACRFRISVHDQVRQNLVLNLDGPDGIFRSGLINRSYAHNLVAGPLNLLAGVLNDLNDFNSGHLFSRANIDADNLGMRVRTTEYFPIKHSLAFDIV